MREFEAMVTKAVWLRVVPIALIALAAAGLCAQAACSGGGGSTTGVSYGYK